jgi:hypothetical protein
MIKGCTKDTIGFEVVLKKGNREKMCGKGWVGGRHQSARRRREQRKGCRAEGK